MAMNGIARTLGAAAIAAATAFSGAATPAQAGSSAQQASLDREMTVGEVTNLSNAAAVAYIARQSFHQIVAVGNEVGFEKAKCVARRFRFNVSENDNIYAFTLAAMDSMVAGGRGDNSASLAVQRAMVYIANRIC